MTSDEREARERRAANQHALNAAAGERVGLIDEEKELRGDRGVTTTTIRLTPNNVFNV
jgi:hypothetical protein